MDKISCVVHTRNAELYLKDCLRSAQWVDELIVIDMESTDRTCSIAREMGAQVYSHAHLGYADPARAFGLSKCSGDWILSLDADEIMPLKTAEVLKKITKENRYDVVYLAFRNYFFGRELKGSGWSYRDIYVPRFYRKGFLDYGHQVHQFIHVKKDSRVLKLIEYDLALIHFNYNSVHHFIEKLNRYTDFEAQKSEYKRWPVLRMIYHFHREFFGRFVVKKGFLDGWVGLYLSLAMSFYRMSAIAKANTLDEKQAIRTYQEYAVKIQVGTKH